MNKREFIKTGLLGTAGIVSLPAFAGKNRLSSEIKEFQLPDLPYAYDALEPFFDEQTMLIHHKKHHAGYTDKLNAALIDSGVEVQSVRELLENISSYNTALRNNGGGYLNHKLWWRILSPEGGGEPTEKVGEEIASQFGSFEAFKAEFSSAANSRFGSGWAWLISKKGKLKITSTANQNSPFMDILPEEERGLPILCVDVWEHAYYLKYKNKRADYIQAFWNVVNWETVNKRYKKSLEN